jgi:hypothetical protein
MTDKRLRLTDLVVDRYVNLELFHRQMRREHSGCLVWTSNVKNNAGYGFIGFRRQDPVTGAPVVGEAGQKAGGMMTVHRLAFMVHHGRLPTKRNVNHTCHNKLCCEPSHLTEGTQREKLDAMRIAGIKGGRQKGATGYCYNHKQANRQYRYSEEEIQWVRTATIEDIMARYNLTLKRAHAFRTGFRTGYRWLPCPEYTRLKPGRTGKESK